MNARNLNKVSATDWARVDQMTDEEIDTSDIPPLDDAFLASAKWRLPRSYLDRLDFYQAREVAAYILKEGLHEKRKTEQARVKQQLVHLAFNTSLIVSYSRPFSKNRNFEGEPSSSLKKEICRVLNESETELHKKVLDMRNSVCAHSDGRANRMATLGIRAITDLHENLDKSETARLKAMSVKWIKYLNEKISLLKGPKNT
ncbi:MAG: hypothetical protein ACR2HX_15935 [Pyrinomonadaceae bacterium]